MNNNSNKKYFIIFFLILLFLPLLEGFFKFLSPTMIYGIGIPNGHIALSKKSFLKGTYQNSLESHLVKGNTFWAYALRIGNQFYYSFFRQISSKLNNSVNVGNEGYFFQSQYLNSFNKSKGFKKDKVESVLKNSIELQEKLKSIGVTLVPLFSPNLISLYPETLPEGYIDQTRFSRVNSYEYITPLLENSKLKFVDSFSELSKLNLSTKDKFFQKTGSHLNELGVCYQLNAILKILSEDRKKKVKLFNCNDYSLIYPPLKKDLDLLEIANILMPEREYLPSYQLNKQEVGFEDGFKPNVLLVGTSFLFDIQRQLEKFNLVKSSPLYFYNKNLKESSTKKLRPISKKTLNLDDLRKYDLIVLETNHSKISSLGNGFITKALKAFSPPRQVKK